MNKKTEEKNKSEFYGWKLVAFGFIFYGLGIAPAYYSWGFFAPEIISELDLTRRQIGEIFGLFAMVLALSSLMSAPIIEKFGLRLTVSVGAMVAAFGWFLVSRADSLLSLYIGYACVGGLGVGCSTLLPAQTLSVLWFKKYRARATAIIFFGAAFFGALVNPVNALILDHSNWRFGWVIMSIISLSVAVMTGLFLRNRPEDLGQTPDGGAVENSSQVSETQISLGNSLNVDKIFNIKKALLTPQFIIITIADIANAMPWRVITAHGRLHLDNLGFAPSIVAAILGIRVGMSGVGRLTGAAGDFMKPSHLLMIALILTSVGVASLQFVNSLVEAYVCVALMGMGYGTAFTVTPVVFASYFGRDAFVMTAGWRVAITGVVGFWGVSWAGSVADKTGKYDIALTFLSVSCLAAALLIIYIPKNEGLKKSFK